MRLKKHEKWKAWNDHMLGNPINSEFLQSWGQGDADADNGNGKKEDKNTNTISAFEAKSDFEYEDTSIIGYQNILH